MSVTGWSYLSEPKADAERSSSYFTAAGGADRERADGGSARACEAEALARTPHRILSRPRPFDPRNLATNQYRGSRAGCNGSSFAAIGDDANEVAWGQHADIRVTSYSLLAGCDVEPPRAPATAHVTT